MPLRIFEPRYVDMVSSCLRAGSGFGVCLIAAGGEVGEAAEIHPVGTLAYIVDWEQLPDGLLGIVAQGEQRFRVLSSQVAPNHLRLAEVELLPQVPETMLPVEFESLAELLGRILDELGGSHASAARQLDQAGWVGARLAELLPIDLEVKQRLLEMDEPVARLFHLRDAMLNLNLV